MTASIDVPNATQHCLAMGFRPGAVIAAAKLKSSRRPFHPSDRHPARTRHTRGHELSNRQNQPSTQRI
jgi:hypothetical protein